MADPQGTGGLIPAHAGKTNPVLNLVHNDQAHPRSRGENGDKHVSGGLGLGSSPLTRGKQTATAKQPHFKGLIPAHAGKTYPCMVYA